MIIRVVKGPSQALRSPVCFLIRRPGQKLVAAHIHFTRVTSCGFYEPSSNFGIFADRDFNDGCTQGSLTQSSSIFSILGLGGFLGIERLIKWHIELPNIFAKVLYIGCNCIQLHKHSYQTMQCSSPQQEHGELLLYLPCYFQNHSDAWKVPLVFLWKSRTVQHLHPQLAYITLKIFFVFHDHLQIEKTDKMRRPQKYNENIFFL